MPTFRPDDNHPPKAVELAWPGGDVPGGQAFSFQVVGQRAQSILRALQDLGIPPGESPEISSLDSGQALAGRYHVRFADRTLFLRISTRLGAPDLEQALLAHLASAKVPVNPILASGWCREQGERLRADIRPFIAGRHFDGSIKDIQALAETLGLLHRTLATLPEGRRIQEISASRYAHFQAMRDRIAADLDAGRTEIFKEHEPWAMEHLDLIARMVRGLEPRFDLLEGAQCLHGEVHPANVIFRRNVAMLIDFEESVHTQAPPSYDLAFLVQRFLLRDQPDRETLNQRLGAAEESYGASFPPLTKMMQQISRLSLVFIIHARAYENMATPLSEYRKFIALEQQARAYEALR